MASLGLQMLASALCLLGWAGVIVTCIMPMWRVTAFVGSTIITSHTIWEGIWMTCAAQSTGQIQCKPYESLLALSDDLQTARALIVLAIAVGGVGLILAFVGGKCTRFLDEEAPGIKSKVAVAAGAVLIVTGLLCLIPTSWVAGTVVRTFYNTAIDAQRRELGACLYIGWGASILLILGGGLFISSSCPLQANDVDKNSSVRYVAVRSTNMSSQGGAHRSRIPSAMSQPVTTAFPKPPSYEAESTKSQLYGKPYWDDGSERSQGSKAPSTKSQMKRPGSTKSELSEAPSTKSQLKLAEMHNNLSELSRSDGSDEEAINAAKTYI
ncbi:claudin-4-like [Thalassophryne amazonica]|uniref:claudin-4-like n=1 Tax=Thalassophryne amazonica TaxID=390379 RepID=UPI0014712F8D|nr:claudin-4-like [Thalassophryne amazonica]